MMNDDFNQISELSKDDLKSMNFYEKALYVQTLNNIEELYDEMYGDDDE